MRSVMANTALTFTEEQGMLLTIAREFVRDKAPISAIREQLDTDQGFDRAVYDEMCALGWSGIALPESVGGSGLGVGAIVPVIEALGYGYVGGPLLTACLASQLLWRAGGQASEAYLAGMAAGEVATLALLDAADWGGTHTGVSIDAAGVLCGCKQQVGDARVAEQFVVTGLREGQPAVALVARDALAGDAIVDNTLIDPTKRAANVDFGGAQATVVFWGPEAATAIRDVMLLGALLTASEAVGASARCLDTTVEYLKTRKQFGKLIGSYQALKHPTVDIYCQLETARSLVYHGASVVSDTPLDQDAEVAARMAKATATELLSFAGDRSVQFHGGIGFTWDCDAMLFIRRAQWTRQVFGDALHHRRQLAALLL